jgi:hypothetical protein
VKSSAPHGDDNILKAFASIEEKPVLRKRYRASLEQFLGDEPKANGKKLLEKIQADFEPEKTARYRVVVENAAQKKPELGSIPWPLCIVFDCCK